MKFMNRETELRCLNEVYHRDASQLLVLYGRRRIGKTELITHWLDNDIQKNTIYWVAYKSSSEILLEKFSRLIAPFLKDIEPGFRFNDWESALNQIFNIAKSKKLVLAIDEFPYLLDSVPEFSSILQMLWDQHKKHCHIILLVCGSNYHMMFQEFVSGKRPLYGRSTADLLLEEIEIDNISLFLPSYSQVQIVETFSIIGGVPKYLEMWNDKKSVFKNIEEIILSPITMFRQEAIFLIQDEISDPRTYIAILEAIGTGLKTPKEISIITGIAINHMGKYLKTLIELKFIRRVISLDTPNISNTKISRYEIKDAYLRFYFTYIHPNLEFIEQKRISRLMTIISQNFDSFVGKTAYEELARKLIIKLGDTNKLSFMPEYVGRVWNKKVEIDIAAINKKSQIVLLGECKWSRKKMNINDLDMLGNKSKLLPKVKDYRIQYALFSKNGFTAALIEKARIENVMLFQHANLERLV
jgi:hypothetical protein